MNYKSNHNVVYSCQYHVVWRPKYRRKVLINGADARLKELICEVAAEHQADILNSKSCLTTYISRLKSIRSLIHRLVRLLKGRSSRVLRQEFPWLKSRLPTLWTNSCFVSTVGGAPLAVIKQYIENQKNV